ncbi:hypothetical protein [Paenibacillus cremeus]|uniref:Uncharacterized protein n=1 Tax=Paenibacillus cremeus TaxID=2163881 RepID=A0A559KCR4_9BACL|nr:hypothetical protein [Paenibacillus cremeus]TVY09918.1 hypothetical protein FPZ49_11140 [Paenibacillus cremeus]
MKKLEVGQKVCLAYAHDFPYIGLISDEVEIVSIGEKIKVKVTEGLSKGFIFEIGDSDIA